MTSCIGFTQSNTTFFYNGKEVSASSRVEKYVPRKQRQKFWKRWRSDMGQEESEP